MSATDPREPSTGFVRIERDLLIHRVGTVLRYRGASDATVVILDAGFEIATSGFSTQTWSWDDKSSRDLAATQAAQFISNRLTPSFV